MVRWRPLKGPSKESELPYIRSTLAFVFLLACISLLPSRVVAQAPISPQAGATVEVLESRIQAVEAFGALDTVPRLAAPSEFPIR